MSALVFLVSVILFNGVLAAARAAFVNASKARLRQMKEEGLGGAALAARVGEDATPLIATLRLGQGVCRFFIAGLAAFLFEPRLAEAFRQSFGLTTEADSLALLIIIMLAALLVMSVGELLPEAVALRAPEDAALFFAPLVAGLEWLLGPLVRITARASEQVSAPLAGQRVPMVTEEEIKTLVDAGEEGGAIEEGEKEMIYSIFAIADTLAREIMIPRIDIFALEVETELSAAVQAVIAAGHSRTPIYQNSIDNIVGLLYAKDLLRVWQGGQPTLLRDLLRPAYFVPETKKVDDLLAELQQQQIHMAVVVDEYGGTAGLVTLEDIVEEIVGEIRDEYDVNEESFFEKLSDTEYRFDARIAIDEVNELCQLDLPNTDSDSLGGFIYGQLGHVPAPGEHVRAGGVQFEVLTVTGRRIRKIRAYRVVTDQPPAEKNDTDLSGGTANRDKSDA